MLFPGIDVNPPIFCRKSFKDKIPTITHGTSEHKRDKMLIGYVA